MDNFMDKIAQKLAAQEAIRANAAADTAQMEKMEAQLAEYDACMKEMRKLNLKNAENDQQLNELLKAGGEQLKTAMEKHNEQLRDSMNRHSGQLEEWIKENEAQMQKLTEECIRKVQETQGEKAETEEIKQLLYQMQETAAANREKIEELFQKSEEYVHKENVKVYRNVQAAIVEELQKQTEALTAVSAAERKEMQGKQKGMFVMNIVTLLIVIVHLALALASFMGFTF